MESIPCNTVVARAACTAYGEGANYKMVLAFCAVDGSLMYTYASEPVFSFFFFFFLNANRFIFQLHRRVSSPYINNIYIYIIYMNDFKHTAVRANHRPSVNVVTRYMTLHKLCRYTRTHVDVRMCMYTHFTFLLG